MQNCYMNVTSIDKIDRCSDCHDLLVISFFFFFFSFKLCTNSDKCQAKVKQLSFTHSFFSGGGNSFSYRKIVIYPVSFLGTCPVFN